MDIGGLHYYLILFRHISRLTPLDDIPQLTLARKSLARGGVILFFFYLFSPRAFIVQASHTATAEDMVAGGVPPCATMFIVEL